MTATTKSTNAIPKPSVGERYDDWRDLPIASVGDDIFSDVSEGGTLYISQDEINGTVHSDSDCDQIFFRDKDITELYNSKKVKCKDETWYSTNQSKHEKTRVSLKELSQDDGDEDTNFTAAATANGGGKESGEDSQDVDSRTIMPSSQKSQKSNAGGKRKVSTKADPASDPKRRRKAGK
jgi:hypothetical protein